MIPLYLVTGFLGSGKTTLLKRILQGYGDSQKIGIIQNEFAPASVDGTDLRSTGKSFEILEINKGSVFCVCLLSDFISSLNEFIQQHQPDMIIVEASGLADPVSIGELLHASFLKDKVYLAHIWCITDASRFLPMEKRMTRITHQVRIADTVIINKTDLVNDIHPLRDRIRELNPYAEILSASYCEVAFHKVLQEQKPEGEPVAVRKSHEFASLEAGGRPGIQSVVIRTSKPVTPEGLQHFLDTYLPKTYRMKGYVRLSDGTVRALQTSFEHWETTDLSNYQGNTEIIVMGVNLQPREMRDMLIR